MPLEAIVEERNCAQCNSSFAIYQGDIPFYRRFDIPTPAICFSCRLQTRLAAHNRRNLYRRKCDATGAEIVSWLSPDKPFKVYCGEYWRGDAWDARDYGRDYDFSLPFFEQFYQLMLDAPVKASATLGELINCEYTNDSTDSKNCFLSFDFGWSEDVLYSETFTKSKDIADCLSLIRCELLYECVACLDCYNLKFSRFCRNCYDSWFLRDCVGCRNCFACTNLRQQEYCLFNEVVGEGRFKQFLSTFASGDYTILQEMQERVENLFAKEPSPRLRGINNENSSGDWLNNCRNAFFCFNAAKQEDCRYCTDMLEPTKDCMDVHVVGENLELAYNSICVGLGGHNLLSCFFVVSAVRDTAYSSLCTRNCANLFGCVGMSQSNYCILNKQYSPDDYHRLRARIVAQMKESGEWGLFFPPQYSYFGYNETLANVHYPLTQEEVLSRGWKWSEYQPPIAAKGLLSAAELPGAIDDVSDTILQSALVCEVTGRPFRLVSKELAFYRKHQLPLPRRHPDQRHRDRLILRREFKLNERCCRICGQTVYTAADPGLEPKVLCEGCYQAEIG